MVRSIVIKTRRSLDGGEDSEWSEGEKLQRDNDEVAEKNTVRDGESMACREKAFVFAYMNIRNIFSGTKQTDELGRS